MATGRMQLRDRRAARRERDSGGGGKRSGRSGTGFGERLEERWRRRQEGRDG
jgi:hypothetical protein